MAMGVTLKLWIQFCSNPHDDSDDENYKASVNDVYQRTVAAKLNENRQVMPMGKFHTSCKTCQGTCCNVN